jgi:hypothetical protein
MSIPLLEILAQLKAQNLHGPSSKRHEDGPDLDAKDPR